MYGLLLHVVNSGSQDFRTHLENERECLRRSEIVAVRERESEAAKAAELRSEYAAALTQVRRLRTDGAQAVSQAREEAAQSAQTVNMLRRQIEIMKATAIDDL